MKQILFLCAILSFLLLSSSSLHAQADYKYGDKRKSKKEKAEQKQERAEKKQNREPSPLKDKFYYIGNVGFGFFNGWSAEFSPGVGYRVTDEFSVGTGVVFQYYSTKYDAISTRETYRNITYGGRIFTRYKIWEGIFAHAELEHLSFENAVAYDPSGIILKQRTPSSGFNIGGGYSSGGPISFNMMALYHVPLSKTTPYTSPLIIRGGIGIGF